MNGEFYDAGVLGTMWSTPCGDVYFTDPKNAEVVAAEHIASCNRCS